MFDRSQELFRPVALRHSMGQIPGWGPGTSIAIMPSQVSAGPAFPMSAVPQDPSAVVPKAPMSTVDMVMMGGVAAAGAAAMYALLSR